MIEPAMTCDRARDLAAGYVLGALERLDEAAVRDHLATCSGTCSADGVTCLHEWRNDVGHFDLIVVSSDRIANCRVFLVFDC